MPTDRPPASNDLLRIVGLLCFYEATSAATDGHIVLRGVMLLLGFGLWLVPAAVRAARAERIRAGAR